MKVTKPSFRLNNTHILASIKFSNDGQNTALQLQNLILQPRSNLNSVSNICEAASRSLFWATNRLTESLEVRFEFPFVDWQIKSTMAFLTGQIITLTPILVRRWLPRKRLRRRFADGRNLTSELYIHSLIFFKCPESYGILCNYCTVHAVVPRAVVLFPQQGLRARGQRKSEMNTEHA